ncbi:hypothetical protein JXB01_03325 [Candidatus Micrarchaeota archaeon]|nr:hypothetical protein [Candidatus Micrarchaeota archaeon]
MRRYFTLLVVIALLLSGCVDHRYNLSVDRTGDAELRMTLDVTQLTNQLYKESGMSRSKFRENVTAQLNERCSKIEDEYPGTKCMVSLQKMTVIQSFEDGFLFEKKEGVPYITYTLEVDRLPLYLVSGDTMLKEEYIHLEGMSKENYDYLKTVESGNGKTVLVIEMPSDIIYAKAGSINAEVDGKKAEFNLAQIAEEPGGIMVVSKELNMFWVYVFVGIIAVIIIALIMKIFRKEKVQE